jgi:hypothetical protein
MQPEFNLAWILPYVRESLRGRGNLNFESFVDELMKVLARASVPTVQKSAPPQSTRRPYDLNAVHQNIKIAITEAFHYLEQNRFILRQPQDMSITFTTSGQWLITERGQEWAKGGEPLPEDYNGYMKQFSPTTDAVVRQYVSEALNTYIRGTYFASAVMIGAASEKAIYLLADSLVATLKDPAEQTALQKKIDARRLESLLKGIEEIVIDGHATKAIPFDVMGGTTRHLLSLFDHIRLQRNEAIHPMNFVVSGDSVRFALNAFPMAFQRVEALKEWCDMNPNSL